jgi:hypothetical protein
MVYQVWDDETGNVIASLDSEQGAVDFLLGMFVANGADGIAQLAVIAYADDGSDPVTVLEGPDLLARMAPAHTA